MTHFFNIYVDIFIIVFYLPYYGSIRYVVLSFDEMKTHYYVNRMIVYSFWAFLQTEMAHFPTLSYTSAREISTLFYT